ncbi:MAG: FAD-binding protein [bacterium]
MSYQILQEKLNTLNIPFQINRPLAAYTTWRLGGPADIFCEIRNISTLTTVVIFCQKNEIPFTILGGGSNVLIADQGIRGLVIKNLCSNIEIITASPNFKIDKTIIPRLIQLESKKYGNFPELEYDETKSKKIQVKISSGTNLAITINHLINKGITGLQWFAGIPGTIGGAVYNNIHGGAHFFSEYVIGVDLLLKTGEIQFQKNSKLNFNYDYSGIQKLDAVILNIYLQLYLGNAKKAKETATKWTIMKLQQPKNSAGCCFKNLNQIDQLRLKLPSNSWGYIIDNILHLKGTTIGGAKISDFHAAFIETNSKAKAVDVIMILNIIFQAAQKNLGISPELEIFLLGFSKATKHLFTKK